MSTAGKAHSQANESLVSSMTAVRITNSECSKHRNDVHARLQQKVDNTKELCSLLASRIRSVKCTLDHSDWSLKKLYEAMAALQEPLEICRGRINLRQKRPNREQVYDPFQEALLKEDRELMNAKGKYSEAIAELQNIMKQLQDQLAELEADKQDKDHAMHIDSLCKDRKKAYEANNNVKLDKVFTGGAVALREVLPEILSSPRDCETAGRVQERQRQKGTMILMERGMKLEEQAKQKWQATTALMDQCKASTANAWKKTRLDMGAKIADTEHLRQELTKQCKVTEFKMAETKRMLGLTQQKIDLIGKPITANTERTRIRGTRTPREAMADEVSKALQLQQSGLETQKTILQRQVDGLHDTLQELESAREQLLKDVSDKEKALAIDRSCAAAKNAAHGNYSYGVAKVGDGQRIFADTSSSMKRRVPINV
jgi:hypothetical protein